MSERAMGGSTKAAIKHQDELALLVRMGEGVAFCIAADDLGIHNKRAETIYQRWRREHYVNGDDLLTEAGAAAAASARRALLGALEAEAADGARVRLRDLLQRLASSRVRREPEAEQRAPNARDLVGAALVDIDWRLERGRRQRQPPRRRQLREARWLLQRAAAVLAGELEPKDYSSPRRGLHAADATRVIAQHAPPELPPSNRDGRVRELYNNTLPGMK